MGSGEEEDGAKTHRIVGLEMLCHSAFHYCFWWLFYKLVAKLAPPQRSWSSERCHAKPVSFEILSLEDFSRQLDGESFHRLIQPRYNFFLLRTNFDSNTGLVGFCRSVQLTAH